MHLDALFLLNQHVHKLAFRGTCMCCTTSRLSTLSCIVRSSFSNRALTLSITSVNASFMKC